jgi:hypothetical protein
MDGEKRFVGIDIAKAALDVFIGPGGAAFSVTNDEVGIRELVSPVEVQILPARTLDSNSLKSNLLPSENSTGQYRRTKYALERYPSATAPGDSPRKRSHPR